MVLRTATGGAREATTRPRQCKMDMTRRLKKLSNSSAREYTAEK